MPAKKPPPPPATPPAPLRRDEWVAEFSNEALRLYPAMSGKHAWRVGLARFWSQDDPGEAATRWVAELKQAATGG